MTGVVVTTALALLVMDQRRVSVDGAHLRRYSRTRTRYVFVPAELVPEA